MYQIPTFHVHIMSVQATPCSFCRHTSNDINGVSLKKRSFFIDMVEEIHSTFSLSSASLTWTGIFAAHYFSPRCCFWDPMTFCLGGERGGGVYTVIDNSSLPMSALELLCCCNNALFWLHMTKQFPLPLCIFQGLVWEYQWRICRWRWWARKWGRLARHGRFRTYDE